MALLLSAATLALAAPDVDSNPPGPRGGPGTDWENPPGPRGGPGASPDAVNWELARLRHYLQNNPRLDSDLPWLRRDNDDNPPGPRGGRGTNWENPPGPRGGPGASPDPKTWPFARLRHWLADHPRLNPPEPGRPERLERPDRPVRPDRPDRSERNVRPERPDLIISTPAPAVMRPLADYHTGVTQAPVYHAPVYRSPVWAAPASRRR